MILHKPYNLAEIELFLLQNLPKVSINWIRSVATNSYRVINCGVTALSIVKVSSFVA